MKWERKATEGGFWGMVACPGRWASWEDVVCSVMISSDCHTFLASHAFCSPGALHTEPELAETSSRRHLDQNAPCTMNLKLYDVYCQLSYYLHCGANISD